TLTGYSNSVHSVVWSPDGTKLASGSWELKIWNAQTGTELQTLTGHRSRIWSVVWSPDGTKLASGSYDKTIKIWKRESIFSHDENNEKSEKTEPSGQLVTAEPTDWLFYTGALAGLCFIGYKLFFNK
ncbi:MAG: WD40 repeat domain-containing protein, partial [Candidatus Babeliales bacterium]